MGDRKTNSGGGKNPLPSRPKIRILEAMIETVLQTVPMLLLPCYYAIPINIH